MANRHCHPCDAPALAGTELVASDRVGLTRHRVDTFADATGDRQCMHVDRPRASAVQSRQRSAFATRSKARSARPIKEGNDA